MARVAMIYLPAGEGGKKQGVDDYLAAEHSVDELLALSTRELRELPREDRPRIPYRATESGLVWEKPTQNGSVMTPLTNFTAKITRDVAEDDGAEVRRSFEIEATLNGRREVFSVPSARFAGMGWATEHLGASAVVYPGLGLKDHARAAVQVLSGDVPTERVYAHTGWRKVDGEWVYLHAGGAIGRDGLVSGVRTELSGVLAGRVLPDPQEAEQLQQAVRASLRVLGLAPRKISIPLLAATYRAPLGESDFSEHISGPTGEGKSEIAALCQQHFGASLDARHLASWESTENALEGQAFYAKDQVVVVDDFAPSGTSHDVQRYHKKADRLLRAKGNASGRQRMRPDTTLMPDKPPRSLTLSTGEDVPRGQSLRARMAVMELGPGQLDWQALTACQKDAVAGLLATAMSGYVCWLARDYEAVRSGINEERKTLRAAASAGIRHRRTPQMVADLALGLRYLLKFAYEVGAIDASEAERLWARGWEALGELAAEQSAHQSAGELTRRFRELLAAALASGRAHVASRDGDCPGSPEAWGWRRSGDEWRAQGERIGWLDGEALYLEPEAAFASAQKQSRDSGDSLTVSGRTLRKRLQERGLLLSTDTNRQTLTVRCTLEGRRREVLHTDYDFLSTHGGRPDQPDHARGNLRHGAISAPPLWSGLDAKTRPAPDHKPDHALNSPGQVTGDKWSDNGRVTLHTPDHDEAHASAKNPTPGQVGRVPQGEGQEPERRVFSV
jgi:hypothetical protein